MKISASFRFLCLLWTNWIEIECAWKSNELNLLNEHTKKSDAQLWNLFICFVIVRVDEKDVVAGVVAIGAGADVAAIAVIIVNEFKFTKLYVLCVYSFNF